MPNTKQLVVVGPGGRGGVAVVVGTVLPHLPEASFVRVGRSPSDPLGIRALGCARAAARQAGIVHVHPSFRVRALARDLSTARVARAAGAGVVFHLHGFDERLLDALDRRAVIRDLWLREVKDVVLASASEALAARLRRFGSVVEVVPNPLDPDWLPKERRPDPRLAIFLGRLVPGKGVEALVSAARGAPFRLVVCGEGPLGPALRASAPANVTFEGWVGSDRRRELLATAGVLVHPSSSEASPLAVLEALGAGVPVVALRVGDVAELVGDAGRALDDPRDLHDAVRGVLADPPDTREARRRILERGDPAAVAARWRALHERARRR